MGKAISTKLKKLEQQIEDGVVGIRTALLEIHDKKLYGECFEAYCKDRWGFSRQHGYNIIKAARAAEQVSTKVDTSGMKTSHLLVIADAPELKQADVACDVLKACEEENRKATAKDFKKAVRAALPAPKKKTPKPTSGDSPLSTGHSGAVESSVERQPGDESEEGGVAPLVKPPKPGSTKDLPGPVHKQAVSSYFSPLARATKKLADMNGGEGPVYREAKQHLNAFSAAFKKLGKGEQ